MDRMFRVLSFWTLVFSLMAFWGSLYPMALIFLGLTAFFLSLGYMNLSERTYVKIFFGFMFVSFVGFTYYTMLVMPVGPAEEHSLASLLLM
ncbi:DUF2626 domain-containing protein [Brevibacillus fluminis]|uniref:DUF2626 domain-containing protein n=1 Tax=Brevibacillus fluminis TaxID=511487 RepID=UPI003F896BFE